MITPKGRWVLGVWHWLRSPRLALTILVFVAGYAGLAAWLPWMTGTSSTPPGWAVQAGLDHPFRSYPFLAACLLLFINTFACTWDRGGRVLSLWRGNLPPYALPLEIRPGRDVAVFLRGEGFRQKGTVYCRFRFALWGGFIFHLGILLLLVSITVQQSFYDGGAFEMGEGETVRLDGVGVVFGRETGPFAPVTPPPVDITLESFDAFLHQPGYASDRSSRLLIHEQNGTVKQAVIDRARGVSAGPVEIFQAIPTGYALNLEIPGMGMRSLHLREVSDRIAVREAKDPAGNPVRFVLEAEHSLKDPNGTGLLRVKIERGVAGEWLQARVPFHFGPTVAKIVSVSRWGGYTYSRSPGIGMVFCGFAVVLTGCLLLLFPAGVAVPAGAGSDQGWRIYLPRGGEFLVQEWTRLGEQTGGNDQPCNQ